jgi:hypothetical protein
MDSMAPERGNRLSGLAQLGQPSGSPSFYVLATQQRATMEQAPRWKTTQKEKTELFRPDRRQLHGEVVWLRCLSKSEVVVDLSEQISRMYRLADKLELVSVGACNFQQALSVGLSGEQ